METPDDGIEDASTTLETVPAEVLEIFAHEADEHLQTVSRCVALLRDQPQDREALQELRRAVHTLKGAAASVGFDTLAKLSHRSEDLLDLLYEAGQPVEAEHLQLIASAHEHLEEMAAGQPSSPALAALYEQLEAAVAVRPTKSPVVSESVDTPPSQTDPTPRMEPEPVPQGPMLKVPIARIEEAVKLLGEQVISRTGLEENLVGFGRLVEELKLCASRLQRVTLRLETQNEQRVSSRRPVNRLFPAESKGTVPYGFDDLEFDRYTEAHLLSRELAETSSDIGSLAGEFSALGGDLDGYRLRQSRLTSDLQQKLMRVRMVPFSHLTARLKRTVRRTAESLGKSVRLVIEGESVELDKGLLEGLSEPLIHLLRNAVDHGIESTDARLAAGKPAEGTITIRVAQESTQVVLDVWDDGRGIDGDRVRAAATARGLAATDASLMELLCTPGVSTAATVSEVSGRGVGLDAVCTATSRLEGTLAIATNPGSGTTFTIRVPLSLVVTRALLVRAGGQTFALPLGCVVQIVRPDAEAFGTIGTSKIVNLGGVTYPVVDLAQRLRLPATESARPPVLLVAIGAERHALLVENVIGGREIVIKPLGPQLRRVPWWMGATLLGDGSVVLIVDPVGLMTRSATPEEARPTKRMPAPVAKAAMTVLVVDDSPSVRRIVSTQLRDAGFVPVTAKDGQDALEILHRGETFPDAVLLDVEMPRMDGFELLATLRSSPTYRDLPVVMLTSRAGDKHRTKAMNLGATAYLVKPYPQGELVTTIRRVCRPASLVNS